MWKPKGGIFLWLKLPDRVDVTKLVEPAAKTGSCSIPVPNGRATRPRRNPICGSASRLPSKEVIRDGVAALARVCYEQTGIPEQSANIRRTP